MNLRQAGEMDGLFTDTHKQTERQSSRFVDGGICRESDGGEKARDPFFLL